MGRSEPGAQAYRDLKNKSVAASFGVGRENMKKIHVEEILLGKNNRQIYPGSGTYEPIPTFGKDNKYNMGYSMRKQLYMDDLKYSKAKKLPGPGDYNHPERVGIGQLNDSKCQNASKYSFGLAEDRFRTGKFNVPAPDSYGVQDGTMGKNFSSVKLTSPNASIGNDKLNYIDREWRMKEKFHGPGPGAYARFSDFSGIERVSSLNPAAEGKAIPEFTGSPQKATAKVFRKPSNTNLE